MQAFSFSSQPNTQICFLPQKIYPKQAGMAFDNPCK